jgi:hypothetical protein
MLLPTVILAVLAASSLAGLYWLWRTRRTWSYDDGWWDGLSEAIRHLESRAAVTCELTPPGVMSYGVLRAHAFQQAAADCADVRRIVDCKPFKA